ncbi:hypothetical protein JL720_11444 [Aureococcus anophagefferens]|nr:hypothetical protein JL720_11444 [Aureococcus anophagefferens]
MTGETEFNGNVFSSKCLPITLAARGVKVDLWDAFIGDLLGLPSLGLGRVECCVVATVGCPAIISQCERSSSSLCAGRARLWRERANAVCLRHAPAFGVLGISLKATVATDDISRLDGSSEFELGPARALDRGDGPDPSSPKATSIPVPTLNQLAAESAAPTPPQMQRDAAVAGQVVGVAAMAPGAPPMNPVVAGAAAGPVAQGPQIVVAAGLVRRRDVEGPACDEAAGDRGAAEVDDLVHVVEVRDEQRRPREPAQELDAPQEHVAPVGEAVQCSRATQHIVPLADCARNDRPCQTPGMEAEKRDIYAFRQWIKSRKHVSAWDTYVVLHNLVTDGLSGDVKRFECADRAYDALPAFDARRAAQAAGQGRRRRVAAPASRSPRAPAPRLPAPVLAAKGRDWLGMRAILLAVACAEARLLIDTHVHNADLTLGIDYGFPAMFPNLNKSWSMADFRGATTSSRFEGAEIQAILMTLEKKNASSQAEIVAEARFYQAVADASGRKGATTVPLRRRPTSAGAPVAALKASFPGLLGLNVYCKLSGLPQTFAAPGWTAADFVPAVRVALDAFSTARLNYAGNWFVALLADPAQRAAYGPMLDAVDYALGALGVYGADGTGSTPARRWNSTASRARAR